MYGKLTFVPASGRAVEHFVSQRLTYVGRDKDCAIRLEDSAVDGKQFVISCVDRQAKIQNLSRKCPTQVNQKTIGLREDYELKDKDTISFGNKQFLWTMSSDRYPSRLDCLKRTRVSEPVRKVAVVTPNRRLMPYEEEWVVMPPEKRRRTMVDPSAATPEPSSFSRRVKYDKQLRDRKMTPSRRKQSMGKSAASPAANTLRKKNISFPHPLESPQLAYDHETAFNKSITPGRFYRRNDPPFPFCGFKTVPEGSMSPGLLTDSFCSMDDTRMSRRSSARMSTPYPSKSMRDSTNSNKTRGASGMYFPTIEEVPHHNQHDATPSSYFSSTSGSPRMMRAESPTVLPGGSGSPFHGKRSLVQSSRSSSYGTPPDQSLHSNNDSMYVNASTSSLMRQQDFEGSSMNQSSYYCTNESSSWHDSFVKTPPRMRTPRRSVGPIESPGSATFSPNASEPNMSGYVLLSPRGRSIINRAVNKNDMSLQLSPQQSPARRLFGFSPRTPDSRRRTEPAQPLSIQVLTKSLRKNFKCAMNSPQTPRGSPSSSGWGSAFKNPEASFKTPSTNEPVFTGTPKSTRSTGLKRAITHQSSEQSGARSDAPSASSPVGAAKRKISVKADGDSPSRKITPTRALTRLSGKAVDLSIPSNPVETPRSEPKRRSNKADPVRPVSDIQRQLSEPNLLRSSRKSGNNVNSAANSVGSSNKNNSLKSVELATPRPTLSKLSLGAIPKQLSEPNIRSSRKSSDLSNSKPLTPVKMLHSGPRRSKKHTPNSGSAAKTISIKPELGDSPLPKAVTRRSRLSGIPVVSTPVSASKNEHSTKHPTPSTTPSKSRTNDDAGNVSTGATPRVTRSSRKSSDLTSSASPPRPSTTAGTPSSLKKSNTFTVGSPDKEVQTSVSHLSADEVTIGASGSPSSLRRSSTFILSSPGKEKHTYVSHRSPDEVAPPNTSIKVNLRSSHKLSSKKKDSPSMPFTASEVPSQLSLRNPGQSKSLSTGFVATSPKSSVRKSLPWSLDRASQRSLMWVQDMVQAKGSGSLIISELSTATRHSRASLVGDAAHLLHLSSSSASPEKSPIPAESVIPKINVIPPTPPFASEEPVFKSRSSRKSGSPSLVVIPRGIHKTSAGKRSVNSATSEGTEIVRRASPGKLKPPSVTKSKRSSQRSSTGEAVTEVPINDKSTPRASRCSSESGKVTPPRSAGPAIVMRSSRKTSSLPAMGHAVPSTPTSALRRNARRSMKRSPVPSVEKKLRLTSARKDSVIRKLSLDPEKPDKNKMAALIACHKKSPVKGNRPSTSSADEQTMVDRDAPEKPTPLKDLDAQPTEGSHADALLDYLYLSRTSAVVEQPKRPSRRLRSLTSQRVSAQGLARNSSQSSPDSPPKSVKKLLFKTPLVEYEGSHPREEKSPARSLKGILMPSPTTASEEPMSRVFTTSPVVDFTDASGRKKVFRASPNSKSEVGGIRELIPADESDLNIWTLFENPSGTTEPIDKSPSEEATNFHSTESANPPRSTRRKRGTEDKMEVVTTSSKRARKVAGGLAKKASAAESAEEATPAKAKSTRRNLKQQFACSESSKPSTSTDSVKPSTSKVASPKMSPKHLRSAVPKAKTVSKAQTTKAAAPRSKAGVSKATSPARTRAVGKSPKKTVPKSSTRAGKATTTVPKSKPKDSKAKPKKVSQPTKTQSKASGGGKRKSPSPAKSSSRSKRGAVARSPKKAVQVAKVQPKTVRGKTAATTSSKSSPKTRKVAAVKSPKKAVEKAPAKAGKTAKPAKSPIKPSTSKAKSTPKTSKDKSAPKTASSRAKTTRASPANPATKISPRKTRGAAAAAVKSPKKKMSTPKAEAVKRVKPNLTKPKTAQGSKPKLPIPPKPLRDKAVGARVGKKSATPKKSPVKTRSQKPATSNGKSSRGKR